MSAPTSTSTGRKPLLTKQAFHGAGAHNTDAAALDAYEKYLQRIGAAPKALTQPPPTAGSSGSQPSIFSPATPPNTPPVTPRNRQLRRAGSSKSSASSTPAIIPRGNQYSLPTKPLTVRTKPPAQYREGGGSAPPTTAKKPLPFLIPDTPLNRGLSRLTTSYPPTPATSSASDFPPFSSNRLLQTAPAAYDGSQAAPSDDSSNQASTLGGVAGGITASMLGLISGQTAEQIEEAQVAGETAGKNLGGIGAKIGAEVGRVTGEALFGAGAGVAAAACTWWNQPPKNV